MSRVKAQAFPNAYLEVDEPPKRSLVVTAASVLSILLGLGMVIGNSVVLSYIIYHNSAPVVFGIELLDGNSLIGKVWGLDVVIVLGVVLTAVAALGALAGYWLRESLKKGGRLEAVLLPFYLFFGVGFEIPALYVFVPLMTVLLAEEVSTKSKKCSAGISARVPTYKTMVRTILAFKSHRI